MAILNYGAQLNNGNNAVDNFLKMRRGLQDMEMNAEALKQLRNKADQEDAQLAKESELQSAAVEAFQSGDPNKVAQLAIQSPELSKRILQAQGIVDQAGLKRVSDRFASVATSTNPRQALMQSVEQGKAAGLNMADSEAILNSDMTDDQIRQQALVSLASIDPNRQQSIQSALTAGAPEPMTAYQSAMVDQKTIDQDLRAKELELKQLESQARKEKDQLQLDKIQADIAKKEADLNQSKKDKATSMHTSIQNTENLVDAIDNLIMNDDYVDALTGLYGKLPTVLPSSTDADVAFDNVLDILTLDNLSLMSGVLTDRDIAVLRSAASGVKRGMTKDAFLKQMRKIKNRVSTKLKKARSDYDKLGVESEPVEATESDSLQPVRSVEDVLKQYGIE